MRQQTITGQDDPGISKSDEGKDNALHAALRFTRITLFHFTGRTDVLSPRRWRLFWRLFPHFSLALTRLFSRFSYDGRGFSTLTYT